MIKKTKDASDLLREHGFRATPIRIMALKILMESQDSLSIQELFDTLKSQMKSDAPDWATVYRVLTQFEESGLVFSFEAHGSKKYEYSDLKSDHHHHLICRGCHRIEHLSSCHSNPFKEMIKPFSFTEISHKLEFYGLCPDCSK